MSIAIEKIFSYTKTIKLLYVEDNEEARAFTLELLSRFFDDITIAKDGIEMSKYIRGINANIPIFLLSAHNESSYEDAAWNVGINEYLTKPLNLVELIEVLSKLEGSNNE